MIEYQMQLLDKHKYLREEGLEDEPNFIQYYKWAQWGDLSVKCTIDIDDNENPDNMFYRGTVTVLADGSRVMEWDSEKKYKLMDVIIGCKRIEDMVASLAKHFTGDKK